MVVNFFMSLTTGHDVKRHVFLVPRAGMRIANQPIPLAVNPSKVQGRQICCRPESRPRAPPPPKIGPREPDSAEFRE